LPTYSDAYSERARKGVAMTYRIKDWHRFQHFRDRKPPWIKLYRDLLDDPEWHELSPAAAKGLVMLWLIASEDSGKLPDTRRIAFRLRIPLAQAERLLMDLSHWLIRDDNVVISPRCHDDAPETEREGETETETERDTPPPPKGAVDYSDPVFPDCLQSISNFREAWDGWMESRTASRHRATNKAKAIILRKLAERPAEAVAAVETATARAWRGFEWAWMEKEKSPRKSFAEIEQEKALAMLRKGPSDE
jgi:hypothetical protein